MSVDVKAALLSIQTWPSLTKEDHAHIKRWLAAASDPIWQKIVTEFEASGELPRFKDGLFAFVIDRALRARRYAENAEYETAERRMQRERQRLEHRQEFPVLSLRCRGRRCKIAKLLKRRVPSSSSKLAL